MNPIKLIREFIVLWPTVFVIASSIGGCASESGKGVYSFGFDLRQDNQHAAILDYWYGNSKADSWIHPDAWYVQKKTYFYTQGITQNMLPANWLYVRWLDTKTGKEYEDTVDLRSRLPKRINDQKVYLMIEGSQLFVYLITSEPRPPSIPSIGPSTYANEKVIMVYPDQPKP